MGATLCKFARGSKSDRCTIVQICTIAFLLGFKVWISNRHMAMTFLARLTDTTPTFSFCAAWLIEVGSIELSSFVRHQIGKFAHLLFYGHHQLAEAQWGEPRANLPEVANQIGICKFADTTCKIAGVPGAMGATSDQLVRGSKSDRCGPIGPHHM